jgi:hypothetical protein
MWRKGVRGRLRYVQKSAKMSSWQGVVAIWTI